MNILYYRTRDSHFSVTPILTLCLSVSLSPFNSLPLILGLSRERERRPWFVLASNLSHTQVTRTANVLERILHEANHTWKTKHGLRSSVVNNNTTFHQHSCWVGLTIQKMAYGHITGRHHPLHVNRLFSFLS
mmetsp:Transcript_4517/g.7826  ORF Transcript_4517/g.7826 Transcript_4517/m.7826 type:complete len:132 (-) Transcript_4517:228-623(-)